MLNVPSHSTGDHFLQQPHVAPWHFPREPPKLLPPILTQHRCVPAAHRLAPRNHQRPSELRRNLSNYFDTKSTLRYE